MQGTTLEWPDIELQGRKELPIVGTITPDFIAFDTNMQSMKEELTNQAIEKRRQEQLNGARDNYSNLQPATAPDPRIGMRIDVLCN